MFGKLGFPALGLAGIGWASAFSFWAMFSALAIYILSNRTLRQYGIFHQLHRFEGQIFRELVQTGWPIGVLFLVESGLFTVTTYLMGYLGVDTLAAHQVVLQTAAVTLMVPVGISYATTVRVGQCLGQQNMLGARMAGYVGISLGVGFMGLMAIAFITIPQPLISLYLDVRALENATVVAIASRLFWVAALFQIFDGCQVIAGGALRGLKDTQIPMIIGILAYWCIGLSCGYLMGLQLGYGGVGLWLGLAIGLAIASVVLTWRFHLLISPLVQQQRVQES